VTRARVAPFAIGIIIAAGAALGAWFVTSDRGDSNGPRYLLWKFGVLPFDPSVVYPAMVGDRQRKELVVGLSISDLERRFGRLRTRAESTAYQKYYCDRFFMNQQILWLGDSPWLIVLDNGRALELHLMKG